MLRKDRLALASLIVIIALILFAFLGPLFFEYDYATQFRGEENIFPCLKYPFGTDSLGRDLLVRTMYGTRISLTVGVCASLLVLVIGSTYGAISGYMGGRTDDVMMRLVDLIHAMPEVLIVLLLSTALRHTGLKSIFIAIGLLYWLSTARIVRGQVLTLKGQDFVMAAKALGASDFGIIKRHLIPNCLGQIIVTTFLQIPQAIFLESFLSFLGVGVAAPFASLGTLISDSLEGVYSYTFRLIIPSVILSILILSFNLLGDGLRDAFDPRNKEL
jgi:oligopeptide transport system permease protein